MYSITEGKDQVISYHLGPRLGNGFLGSYINSECPFPLANGLRMFTLVSILFF